jgi:GNAT superfamily N-acetyltransferase
MTNRPARSSLRPLAEDDIPAVMELYRRAIRPVWIENERDHDLSRVEANIQAHVGGEGYWMIVASGASTSSLSGYLAWERHEDHTGPHVVAHLRMILVDPDAQGTGLGKLLMDHFEGQARAEGCTKVLFDVVTGSPARRFYDSLGYRHWSDYMEKFL